MLENIRDIFAILHDGTIVSWQGDKTLLTLTVSCAYLAKRINPMFEDFIIEINLVNVLSFSTWPNPFNLPVQLLTKAEEIFKLPLQLLYSEIKNNAVEIECSIYDDDFDYCGGILMLSCNQIKIYDQERNELTVEALDIICKEYWAGR